MDTAVIFGTNMLVALMCSGAIGLLLYGAYQDGESNRRTKRNVATKRAWRIDVDERTDKTRVADVLIVGHSPRLSTEILESEELNHV
ncbi:MAG: hypothetical protein O7E52_15335 [Candidatus Poribacteria bacterium]|nr:hypothetical protein [Candidatus Poribacteria bacterium]